MIRAIFTLKPPFDPVSHRVKRFSESAIELTLFHSDSFRQLKTRQLRPIFPRGDLHDEKDSHLRLRSTDQASQFEIPGTGMPELEENTVREAPYLVEIGIDGLAQSKSSCRCGFQVL